MPVRWVVRKVRRGVQQRIQLSIIFVTLTTNIPNYLHSLMYPHQLRTVSLPAELQTSKQFPEKLKLFIAL